jgi:ABC-type transport system involved in cytochrome c biogenesis permease component
VIASPVVAMLGVPGSILFALGLASMVCAVLLAAFGAITGVAIMLRMRAGQYLLPSELKLPLPPGMRPELVTAQAGKPVRLPSSS